MLFYLGSSSILDKSLDVLFILYCLPKSLSSILILKIIIDYLIKENHLFNIVSIRTLHQITSQLTQHTSLSFYQINMSKDILALHTVNHID